MSNKIKRRQFGQLAAGSLTATLLADLSGKVLAQNQERVWGVSLLNSSEVEDLENIAPGLELVETNVNPGGIPLPTTIPPQAVENIGDRLPSRPQAFFLPPYSRVTAITTLTDGTGTLVIATYSQTKNKHPNKLVLISDKKNKDKIKVKAKKIKDFDNPHQTIESFVSYPDDPNLLLCIVGHKGVPPFIWKFLNLRNNKILPDLPPFPPINHRMANLCLAPNGRDIFATETGPEGPILISFNLQNKSQITGKVIINRLNPLSFDSEPAVNDALSLTFSANGKLYALATDTQENSNGLYEVELRTPNNLGRLREIKKLKVEKLTIST
ncbi:hypothetical protein PCC7424_5118 [Gloeothece citriformis PCC 7424]|uniref:Uncharacterized protein n=1 Tax=Gloeothece citriformis (strain PCC 7424) TaxID=65393 RepID=B7KGY2_GLOC7|nr:hypothetical protein [Gloeothece citriformis]ACK73469.1 hypothetical protein PCC7424_5118 [Gloeothece citriformis PCC 7424]